MEANAAESQLTMFSTEKGKLIEKVSSLTKKIALLESENQSLRYDLESISRNANRCIQPEMSENEREEAETKTINAEGA